MPPRLENSSVSPTVSTLLPSRNARMSFRRDSSDRLMNKMWQTAASRTVRQCRTTILRSRTVSFATISSKLFPNGSSPSTPITNGAFSSEKASAGHSTNCAKLNRNAAFRSYSRVSLLLVSAENAATGISASTSTANAVRTIKRYHEAGFDRKGANLLVEIVQQEQTAPLSMNRGIAEPHPERESFVVERFSAVLVPLRNIRKS